MKQWNLYLAIAAVALSLQACDVTIHESPKEQGAATSEPAPPTASTQQASTSIASSVPQEPVESEPAAEAPTASVPADTAAHAPEPQTNAMGAPAATAPDSAAAPAAATAEGVAAPTELARFFQENPIRPATPRGTGS